MSAEEASALTGEDYVSSFGLEEKLEEMVNLMLETKPADPCASSCLWPRQAPRPFKPPAPSSRQPLLVSLRLPYASRRTPPARLYTHTHVACPVWASVSCLREQ